MRPAILLRYTFVFQLKERNEAPSNLAGQERELIQGTTCSNEVVSKILTFFKRTMSICSLEAELRFREHSVIVKNCAQPAMKLVRCRLILDVEKGKIKLNIRKSAAVAVLVPYAVTKAVSGLNTALSCIPLQNQATVIKVFTAVFKIFTSGNNGDEVMIQNTVDDDVISQNDVIVQGILTEEVLNETSLTDPSKLFSTLLALDVKIMCPTDVVVELKRRQILAGLRRQTVTLDAKEGLQIIKKPSAILRRKKNETAIEVLASWASSRLGLSLWQNIIDVIKCLQVGHEH